MDYLYIVILVFFQLSFLVQLYYIFIYHLKFSSYKLQESVVNQYDPVSLIICARNELPNLQKNLPLIINQDHPNFELVIVNDCSNDGSDWFLKEFAEQHSHVKIVTIDDHPRFKHGKKFAVTLGIKASKNENIIFTDADCRPASNRWLGLMQRNFDSSTEIVLGYSPYQRLSGLLNLLIRYETFLTALNYFSFSITGKPYMGVGRNMAYTKSLFFRGKGFASHMHIPSGDDDLFVNQNANLQNTRIELDPDSHVISDPKTSWSAFFSQKLRHMGAGKAYKKEHQQILSIQAGSGVLFYLTLLTLIGLGAQWWLLASVFLVRCLVQLIIYLPALDKLRTKDLIWWLPLLDFIYYLYIFVISVAGVFKKKVVWK